MSVLFLGSNVIQVCLIHSSIASSTILLDEVSGERGGGGKSTVHEL